MSKAKTIHGKHKQQYQFDEYKEMAPNKNNAPRLRKKKSQYWNDLEIMIAKHAIITMITGLNKRAIDCAYAFFIIRCCFAWIAQIVWVLFRVLSVPAPVLYVKLILLILIVYFQFSSRVLFVMFRIPFRLNETHCSKKSICWNLSLPLVEI